MKSTMILLLLFLTCFIFLANGGNILCLMGAASESAQIRSHVLFKTLAARGHKLTILSEAGYIKHVNDGWTDENISYINLYIARSEVAKDYGTSRSQVFKPYQNMMMWYDRLLPICQEILTSEGFLALLELGIEKSEERLFDMIIYDVINAPPCLLSLAQVFVPESSKAMEVPLVGLSLDSKVLPEIFEQARGGAINPASVPHFMSEFSEDMSYFERVYNLILYLMSYFVRHWLLSSKIESLTNHNLKLRNAGFLLDYEAILERVRLILVNTHPTFNYAQPLPPNVIDVPGWHIADDDPLPSEVLNFIGNSSRGVVFMSLGCNYRIDVAEEQKRTQTILAVIKRLPKFVFLWKVKNGKTVKKPPGNLYMSESLSETDVLAHPKTRLYFTEADTMKLQEAIYHGVPVLAVPMLIDQLNNAKRVYERRLGMRIHFELFREETFHAALSAMLNNYSTFKLNAKHLQMAFRNRIHSPLDAAVWWIEQVLKNPEGFRHLVSPTGGQLNDLVLLSYDVILLVLILFAMWFWTLYVMSSGTLWFMVYGSGRYYTIMLIRLIWSDFLEEEIQQLHALPESQEEEQTDEQEGRERGRERGRGRGRASRRRK